MWPANIFQKIRFNMGWLLLETPSSSRITYQEDNLFIVEKSLRTYENPVGAKTTQNQPKQSKKKLLNDLIRPTISKLGESGNFYNHRQNVWDKLWFSCEIGHYRKSSISIFQEFLASIEKNLILGGRLSTRL